MASEVLVSVHFGHKSEGLILKSGMSSTQFVGGPLGALKISFTDVGSYSLYNISQNHPVRALSDMGDGDKLILLSNLPPTIDNQPPQVSKVLRIVLFFSIKNLKIMKSLSNHEKVLLGGGLS